MIFVFKQGFQKSLGGERRLGSNMDSWPSWRPRSFPILKKKCSNLANTPPSKSSRKSGWARTQPFVLLLGDADGCHPGQVFLEKHAVEEASIICCRCLLSVLFRSHREISEGDWDLIHGSLHTKLPNSCRMETKRLVMSGIFAQVYINTWHSMSSLIINDWTRWIRIGKYCSEFALKISESHYDNEQFVNTFNSLQNIFIFLMYKLPVLFFATLLKRVFRRFMSKCMTIVISEDVGISAAVSTTCNSLSSVIAIIFLKFLKENYKYQVASENVPNVKIHWLQNYVLLNFTKDKC